jgi:hypothetical protein
MEGLVSYTNPLFTDPLGPLLIEQPSTRFLDAYSSYYLPASSTTRPIFWHEPTTFGFPEGLGVSPPLSTTPVVDPARAHITIVGASSLLGTSM